MSLLAALITDLGTSIAKSILKIWLKDSELASDASSTLIDTLKGWAGENVTRQRAMKQCEDVGKSVAKRVLSSINIEGAQADSVNPTAIVHSAAETLQTLSSALIVQLNLNPSTITTYLLAHPVGTGGFSESEHSYFQRIIAESCPSIVTIASQLPAFTEAAFAEILTRGTIGLDVTRQTAHDVHSLLAYADHSKEHLEFERDYLQAVVSKLDTVQLFGVDSSTARRGQRLSIAYVTLSLEQKVRAGTDIHQAMLSDRGDGQQRQASPIVLSTEQALKDVQRLLIRGEAGSGKTTLLQWIAINAAQHTLPEPLAAWNQLIPFYIRLRDHEDPAKLSLKAFPQYVTQNTLEECPRGWVQQVLHAGRALLLVDGLDEVPGSKRDDVRDWLKTVVTTYPDVTLLVTSRPNAVEEGWMDPEGFRETVLQKMSLTDIHTFIDHWHEAVEKQLFSEHEKRELSSHAQELKKELERHSSIQDLATSPLLCAMLCTLSWERHGYIPSGRIELYEACCKMLIERRDKERKIDLASYPAARLDLEAKIMFLARLAHWMVRNNHIQIERVQVEACFSRTLKQTFGMQSSLTETDIYTFFVQRTSLIREPIVGHIDFTHRTFQEYLAARAMIDEEDLGLLTANAHDDQWKELIPLAAGIATLKKREHIIHGILQRGDQEANHRYKLYLLACSCLLTSNILGQQIRQELLERVGLLIPPEDTKVAQALGALGEEIIPLLVNKPGYTDQERGLCIQALAATHCEQAVEVIKTYSIEKGTNIIHEMVDAWDSFEKEKYFQDVIIHLSKMQLKYQNVLARIPYLSHITDLVVTDCQLVQDLSALGELKQLTKLYLDNCQLVQDLSVLGELKQLTELSLRNCQLVQDLSALGELKQLTELSLDNCQLVQDLSALGELKQLTKLSLDNCQLVQDLSALGELKQLTLLYLRNCQLVQDLSALGELKQLTELSLDNCQLVQDLSVLGELKQLTALSLYNCPLVQDLSVLGELKQLTQLFLYNCRLVQDLSVLGELKQLTELYLDYCQRVQDLSVLGELKQLTQLFLRSCPLVQDLSVLGELKQLTTLSLSSCQRVQDLSVLGELKQLTQLSLWNCPLVQDLSALGELKQLTELSLDDCQLVQDLSALGELKQLTELSLWNCQLVQDLSALGELKQLTKLSLDDCQLVQDLSALGELKQLIRLTLYNCPRVNESSILNDRKIVCLIIRL